MEILDFLGEDFDIGFSQNTFNIDDDLLWLDKEIKFDNMWKNSGTWHNFGNGSWNEKSSRWSEGHWNSFYGLGDFDKHINDTVNDINGTISEITAQAQKILKEAEIEMNKITTKVENFGKIMGIIKFSYKVNNTSTFRRNWDDRVADLNKTFTKYNIISKIDTDNAEYDRESNKVTGLINFSIDFTTIKDIKFKTINKEKATVECLFDASYNVRRKHNIVFETINADHTDIYDFRRETYKDKEPEIETPTEHPTHKPEVEKLVEKIEEQKQEIVQQPKWLKILDDTKKRFRKRTFEIVKQITEIDDIPVNCYIVRQVRGDKDRKRYTLNANDCELLGIEYREGLEVLPGDLEYENVYRKVKNENYKEK